MDQVLCFYKELNMNNTIAPFYKNYLSQTFHK
jgi:hypothetical protein